MEQIEEYKEFKHIPYNWEDLDDVLDQIDIEDIKYFMMHKLPSYLLAAMETQGDWYDNGYNHWFTSMSVLKTLVYSLIMERFRDVYTILRYFEECKNHRARIPQKVKDHLSSY